MAAYTKRSAPVLTKFARSLPHVSTPVTATLPSSAPPALFLTLPGLLLLNWYGWLSFAKLHRYQQLSGETAPIKVETYQIALHDTVTADWRRVFMPPPPEEGESKLETFRLVLDRAEWGELMDSASIRDDRPYVRGKVEDSELDTPPLEARIRLRGGRHWHLGETQKSFKVKMDKGELLVGSRVGNLLNDPTPMVVGEQLILDNRSRSGHPHAQRAFRTGQSKFQRSRGLPLRGRRRRKYATRSRNAFRVAYTAVNCPAQPRHQRCGPATICGPKCRPALMTKLTSSTSPN